MKEIGQILEIQNKKITVKGGKVGECFGCMSHECHVNCRIIQADNIHALPLSVGLWVEVDNPVKNVVFQGLAVLLPPILLFIAGYLITMLMLPASGDEVRAAVGVISLFIGFFAVYWLRNVLPAGAGPRVIRVVEPPSGKDV